MSIAPPRILVADDQADIRAALELLLKAERFSVVCVDSPAAVLEALRTQSFDLLLMDLNYTRDTTTGREGLDLVARIEKMDDTLPIVAMTAWASIDLAVQVMRHGVRDFVQKPWDNAKLVETLSHQIRQGRQLRRVKRLTLCREKIAHLAQKATDVADLLGSVARCLQEALRNKSETTTHT